jgi:LacI family transcriptional regulator
MRALSRLKDWGATGVIARDSAKIDELLSMGLPVIIANATKDYMPNLPNIVDDCEPTGAMAAEHLLSRGFRRFAYCGFDDRLWSRKRGEAFAKSIEEAGHKAYFYKPPRLRGQRLWENEPTYIADWLKVLSKPLGLMTCADHRSQHVIEACRIAGLHVPEEVAVLGVDNDELVCDLSDPPLSSIALDTERAGYEAAELLDKLMKGEKMAEQQIMVSPLHVVARQSTDILAIEDKEVAEAVRFIRQNSKSVIQVVDVAEHVALSRRSLERRFRKILSWAVHDEIKRVRTNQIARMLLEANQSISQIALSFGFPGVEQMCRFFRREKGINPQAYRNRYAIK